MHALETCAGIDDANPHNLKTIPRTPQPLTGIKVSNFHTLIPQADSLTTAHINYTYKTNKTFSLTSDVALPTLSVRLGPFAGQNAFWLWVENLKNTKNLNLNTICPSN